MPISDEKYVSLTTFRSDGSAASTPVWIADLGDGTIGFTTASSSFKVKRIRNDPRVTLQPSNAKGEATPGSDVVSGTATIVSDPQEFEACVAIVKKKYGIQYRLITLWGRLAKLVGKGSGTDCVVKIRVT